MIRCCSLLLTSWQHLVAACCASRHLNGLGCPCSVDDHFLVNTRITPCTRMTCVRHTSNQAVYSDDLCRVRPPAFSGARPQTSCSYRLIPVQPTTAPPRHGWPVTCRPPSSCSYGLLSVTACVNQHRSVIPQASRDCLTPPRTMD